MTQEAMKLALEALRNYAWHGEACPQHPTYSKPENYPKCTCGYDKAITAIEEALAQPEQEPVAWEVGVVDGVVTRRLAPPQRTWVGLTDEEISGVLGSDIHDEPSGELRFIRAIEAKLKEKNT